MDGVKRYGHISYLVEATPQILKLYPDMTVYVWASDFDAALAREVALREELAIIKDECIDHMNLHKAWTKQRDGLQQRLTAAEQRNATFQETALDVISDLGEFCCGLQSQSDVDYITGKLDKLAALIKPAESHSQSVEYGPTLGCKQCEEAENCGLTDCPECDAKLCEDVNGTGVKP